MPSSRGCGRWSRCSARRPGTTGSAAVSGVDRSVAVAPDADDAGETVCGAVVGRSDSGAVDPGGRARRGRRRWRRCPCARGERGRGVAGAPTTATRSSGRTGSWKWMCAFSVARLTVAATPSSLLSLRSTREEHDAQVIPPIARSSSGCVGRLVGGGRGRHGWSCSCAAVMRWMSRVVAGGERVAPLPARQKGDGVVACLGDRCGDLRRACWSASTPHARGAPGHEVHVHSLDAGQTAQLLRDRAAAVPARHAGNGERGGRHGAPSIVIFPCEGLESPDRPAVFRCLQFHYFGQGEQVNLELTHSADDDLGVGKLREDDPALPLAA